MTLHEGKYQYLSGHELLKLIYNLRQAEPLDAGQTVEE